MTDDHREQLRHLVDQAIPISAEDIQAHRQLIDERSLTRSPGRRRPIIYASVAAVFVLVIVALAVVRGTGRNDPGDPSDYQSEQGLPPATVLASPGDDPMVRCAPDDPWFPYSALSGPTVASDDPDPAVQALNLAVSTSADPPGGPGGTGWRRLAATDNQVFFGMGEPPLFLHVTVERQPNGQWRSTGRGGGYCSLRVQPPAGLSSAGWGIDQTDPPQPESTEIQLLVSPYAVCPGPPLQPDEIVGPDVVETTDTVTIRLALDRPPRSDDPSSDGCGLDDGADPLRVTVQLREPLGERQLLDGDSFPPSPAFFPPEPQDTSSDAPHVEFPDGTVDVDIHVVVNDDGICGAAPPLGCQRGTHPARLEITTGDITRTVDTDRAGQARATIPADTGLDVVATDENLRCGHRSYEPEHLTELLGMGEPFYVSCTRLDLPHATITGVAHGGDQRQLVFLREGATSRSVPATIGPDESFEVVLEPGIWTVQIGSSYIVSLGCGPVVLVVEPDVDQNLDLTCS
jgi:hypothetical protein